MMMNGRNNGKKLMAVRIVAHAFEIVRLSLNNFSTAIENMLRHCFKILLPPNGFPRVRTT